MKRVFLYLLNKYSNNEADRVMIHKVLNEQVTINYSEQTTFGNVYNANIEFLMSQPFIAKLIKDKDYSSIHVLRGGMSTSFDEAVGFVEREIVNPKTV